MPCRIIKFHLLDVRRYGLFGRKLTRCGKTWEPGKDSGVKMSAGLQKVLVRPLKDQKKMCRSCMQDLRNNYEDDLDAAQMADAVSRFEEQKSCSAPL